MLILTYGNAREVNILFNEKMLKAKIIERGKTILQICNCIGICEATYYRKLQRNGDFSRFEIEKISELLSLTEAERNSIFFAA